MPQVRQILLNRFFLSAISAVLVIAAMIFIFLAPVSSYFDFYSLFSPRAMKVNDSSVLWQDLKSEFDLVSFDKSLKTRKQRLEKALDKAVERQLLKQALPKESATLAHLTFYNQYQQLKGLIEQSLVNKRTGEFFIVTFKSREATESAQGLKMQARNQISTIHDRLKKGDSFKDIYADAEENSIIKKLNFGYFLPGRYLENITQKEFPLQIKSFREAFFKLKEKEVSEIITLSWDNYEGPSYDQQVSGEFAYAVIKIDKVNPNQFNSYDEWLTNQKQRAQIKSFVFIPFYFRWL